MNFETMPKQYQCLIHVSTEFKTQNKHKTVIMMHIVETVPYMLPVNTQHIHNSVQMWVN